MKVHIGDFLVFTHQRPLTQSLGRSGFYTKTSAAAANFSPLLDLYCAYPPIPIDLTPC